MSTELAGPAGSALTEGLWRTALLLACLALTACDVSGDEPVMPVDVGILTTACKVNGGLKEASRVRDVFNDREWRVQCTDGARFIFRAP